MIGGVDCGLRMGGRCIHTQSSRTATMLGVLKEGATCIKVLWDDADATIRSVEIKYLNFQKIIVLVGKRSCTLMLVLAVMPASPACIL